MLTVSDTQVASDQLHKRRQTVESQDHSLVQFLSTSLGEGFIDADLLKAAQTIGKPKGISIDRNAESPKEGRIMWFCEHEMELFRRDCWKSL
jgi:hypothetical protein